MKYLAYLNYSRPGSLCNPKRLNDPINLYFDFEYILANTGNMRLEVILASTLDLYLFVNCGSIGWNALKTGANEI